VASEAGQRPVITGENALTGVGLDYWSEVRGVLKIGGSSVPGAEASSWIVVQGLDIQGAHPDHGFTDDRGSAEQYADNAAAVFVEQGDHVSIIDCRLSDSGNGLFVASAASEVAVLANTIEDNGIVGSVLHHNSYTEALGIEFAHNTYGPPKAGSEGNNLKDRSAGTVIRYNRIEGGNRQLDLVDSGSETLRADPRYGVTRVYGNLLVEPDGAGNSQIVHYGGDSDEPSRYRKGRLELYHNTVVSERAGSTTLVRLSTDEESADIRNNAVVAAGGLAITAGTGGVVLAHNWLPEGWRDTFEASFEGTLEDRDNTVGTAPGIDAAGRPESGSPLLDAAGPLSAASEDWPADQEHSPDGTDPARADDGAPDIGAFEG
jgi:hypothetical protein